MTEGVPNYGRVGKREIARLGWPAVASMGGAPVPGESTPHLNRRTSPGQGSPP